MKRTDETWLDSILAILLPVLFVIAFVGFVCEQMP